MDLHMALAISLGLAILWLPIIAVILRRRPKRDGPSKTNWPIVGDLPGLVRNFTRLHDYITELLDNNGGTLEFRSISFSNSDFFITSDPRNYQHILGTNFANYPKGPEFREIFEVLGDGILSVDSDLWRHQRKMFQLWNAQQSKTGFVSGVILRKVVNDLIPFLDHVSQTGIQVDLQEVFQKMITFDNSISLIFGFDLASHSFKFSIPEYQKAFGDIQETVLQRHFIPTRLWKIQKWLGIGSERKHKNGCKIFDEFLYDCLSLKCKEPKEEENETNSDMISIFLEEKENPYSNKFLKDFAMNLAAASRDTFTSILTWFFWLVATHPSVEAKILEEIEEKVLLHEKDENILFEAEELSKLVYLHAALQETLRLYPPLPFNHKTAAKEDTLPSGHRVEPKGRVLLSFYSTGRSREIWGEDCLEFKPERWIDPETRDRLIYVPSHKFPVFNVGPRTCLGKDMVMIQTKIIAINFLRRYRIQVVQGHPISPTTTVTLHMKHGLIVNVSKRY